MDKIACIVLPTYNEAGNISKTIKGIFAQVSKIKTHELHVLVVDDNSPDGTQEVVKKEQKKFSNLHLISGNKQGLGGAYKKGFKFALKHFNPELVFEMDADGQHDPALIPQFISMANEGFSLVVGSRFIKGSELENYSKFQCFLRRIAIFITQLVLGKLYEVCDFTSGFRCIHTDYLHKVKLEKLPNDSHSFQLALLYQLLKKDALAVEVPINFKCREHGRTKLTFKKKLQLINDIAQIRIKESEEFIKFCIVGGTGVFVNLGAYVIATRVLGLHLSIAGLIGIEISIITNFFLNNSWTFKKRDKKDRSFLSKFIAFHLVSGIAGVVNYAIFITLAQLIGMFDILANCIGIISAMSINYILNSKWTWSKNKNI